MAQNEETGYLSQPIEVLIDRNELSSIEVMGSSNCFGRNLHTLHDERQCILSSPFIIRLKPSS